MQTLYVYPVADGATTDWTPSVAAAHYTLVDENPPNETDKISVAGFSAGKVERLTMGSGPANTIVTVRTLKVQIHLKSAGLGNTPALRLRVYRNGAYFYQVEFQCDTADAWGDIEVTIPIGAGFSAAEWYNGTFDVFLLPINGDAGYLPAS